MVCNACGTPFAASAPEDAREERKVVGVLFCDLVGFTARSERLDPEDVRAFLAPYHGSPGGRTGAIRRYRAEVIRDAVVGLFGAPVAHEGEGMATGDVVNHRSTIADRCARDGHPRRRADVSRDGAGDRVPPLGAGRREGEGWGPSS